MFQFDYKRLYHQFVPQNVPEKMIGYSVGGIPVVTYALIGFTTAMLVAVQYLDEEESKSSPNPTPEDDSDDEDDSDYEDQDEDEDDDEDENEDQDEDDDNDENQSPRNALESTEATSLNDLDKDLKGGGKKRRKLKASKNGSKSKSSKKPSKPSKTKKVSKLSKTKKPSKKQTKRKRPTNKKIP